MVEKRIYIHPSYICFSVRSYLHHSCSLDSSCFFGLPETSAGDETHEDLCVLRQGNSKYGEVVGNSVLITLNRPWSVWVGCLFFMARYFKHRSMRKTQLVGFLTASTSRKWRWLDPFSRSIVGWGTPELRRRWTTGWPSTDGRTFQSAGRMGVVLCPRVLVILWKTRCLPSSEAGDSERKPTFRTEWIWLNENQIFEMSNCLM